jgi:uncharacterized repeat protein (TIGR01451 family)
MNGDLSQPSRLAALRRLALPLALAALLMAVTLGLVLAQEPATRLTRVTTESHSDRDSVDPSISRDGDWVAFESDSDFLDEGRQRWVDEIWLWNRQNITFTRVTSSTPANRDNYDPSISGDGRWIAFRSNSDFLGEGLSALAWEIWLYDRHNVSFTRVTSASHPDRDSWSPRISADGQWVVFSSDSDFLNEGRAGGNDEIWLYDRQNVTFTRVTSASHADRNSTTPSISDDASWVAFRSDSDLLDEGRADDVLEIWLYDRQNLTLTRVTSATHPAANSVTPSISGGGDWVAFESSSDFLGEGRPLYTPEIWLYDRLNVSFTRVTSASRTDRQSDHPDISNDGRWVAFRSDSDFLDEGRPLDHHEIWLYDRQNVSFTRVTSASHTDRDSDSPSISGDGKYVAFYSDSDFDNQGGWNEVFEIWLSETLPELQLTKTASGIPAPGAAVNYSIVVHNQGFGSATGAVVSDTLDPRLEFLAPVTLDPSSAGTPGSAPPILASELTVPAGQSVTITFRAIISTTGVVSGTVIDNTAAVTSSEVSTVTADSVSITVRPRRTYLPTVIKG